MEGWGNRKEGEVRRQFFSPVEALDEGICEDGGHIFVRNGSKTEGPCTVHGHQERVPPLPSVPVDERLVHISLEGQLLSVPSALVWVGKVPLWFTQLIKPFIKELKSYGYRTLTYLD